MIERIQQTGSTVRDAAVRRIGGDRRHTLDSERFARALQESRLKISGHALERMQQRNIRLDEKDVGRITDALDQAARKGARESLFVMKNVALVVSITNRTVITAVDGESARDNVFTNIDSAVML